MRDCRRQLVDMTTAFPSTGNSASRCPSFIPVIPSGGFCSGLVLFYSEEEINTFLGFLLGATWLRQDQNCLWAPTWGESGEREAAEHHLSSLCS